MNHFEYSMIKSAFRMIGLFILPFTLKMAALLLIVAEVVGVLEEYAEDNKK